MAGITIAASGKGIGDIRARRGGLRAQDSTWQLHKPVSQGSQRPFECFARKVAVRIFRFPSSCGPFEADCEPAIAYGWC